MSALLMVSDTQVCEQFYKGFAKNDRKKMMELMHVNGVIKYELSEPLLPPPAASLI